VSCAQPPIVPLRIGILVSVTWCLLLPVDTSTAAVSQQPGYAADGFCAQVTDALGVPQAGSGILDALTLVYGDSTDKARADAASTTFDRFDEFAQRVLAGSEPSLLESRVLEFIDVASG